MNKQEIIYAASVAIGKRLSYETMKYSDDLYGHEDDIDLVWGYVEECEEIGKISFREKYKEYELYCM